MALDAFAGVLTAKGIVDLARRRVGNPDLHLDLNGEETVEAPAYKELQILLDHLATAWDWPFSRTVCTFTVSGRSTDMPTHFWRIGFQDPFYIIDSDGGRSRLVLVGQDTFHDTVTDGTGRPERGYVLLDSGAAKLIVEPAPDASYTAEVHYYPWQCALVDTSDKPWFPYSAYLVSALAVRIAIGQDDSRVQEEAALATSMMKEIRQNISDGATRGLVIPLSRQFYRTPRTI